MKRQIYILLGVGLILLIGLTFFVFRPRPSTSAFNINDLIKKAESKLEDGDTIAARALFIQAKQNSEDPNILKSLTERIEALNIKILFSSTIDVCGSEYIVKPKDTLINIANKFGTTVELIKKANNLDTNIIRPQQKLKVNKCRFSLAVDKSLNYLLLKHNDRVIKSYLVSTGKDNSTPTGAFKIINKLRNPTWFKTGAVVPPDSPENILGSRWMGLNVAGYGIHGNRDVNEIGKQVTQGCIRMKNDEVEELYDIVPIGTEVVIRD